MVMGRFRIGFDERKLVGFVFLEIFFIFSGRGSRVDTYIFHTWNTKRRHPRTTVVVSTQRGIHRIHTKCRHVLRITSCAKMSFETNEPDVSRSFQG